MISKTKLSYEFLKRENPYITCSFVSEDWYGFDCYYIKLNGEIISIAIWNIDKNIAQIYCLETLIDFRNKRYASQILKEIEKECLIKGVHKIRLISRKSAIAFYEKQGFSIVHNDFMIKYLNKESSNARVKIQTNKVSCL